ncbi:MAG TPA: glycoside hydrolase family 36 protein, partial [Acidimicrobiia bacterium]|nr:glycoside hydrolase family 36 protein [Acidimicrobiia bacterium]
WGAVVDDGAPFTVDLDPATSVRLVNGYQSWDYAGVRPGDEPGHTWWGGAVAEPETGRGVAFHALTAVRTATAFATEPADGRVAVRPVHGRTPEMRPVPGSWGFQAPLPDPHPQVAAEPYVVGASGNALAAMEDVARAVADASGAWRWSGPPIIGWESWYHYGFSVTPDDVLANGRLMREWFADRPGFRLLQIDDGWQRAYGDWRPGDGWPADLGDVAAEIRALGCLPGLWLAPFMVWPGGPGIGGRPDLLVHGPDGSPRTDPLMGRHGVDATNPESRDWLRALGATVRGWGFQMVKLDFLYIGAIEGHRHDPDATGTEAMRAGLGAFVDGLGPDVYVLACGAPMLPVVGLCHGNRVGGDLAAPLVWPFPDLVPFPPEEGWRGVAPQARNVAARWWCHRRLFDVDPDVVMAAGPGDGPPYATEEARTLAVMAAMAGGPYFMADDLAALPREKRDVLADPVVTDLAWGGGFRPVDLFARPDRAPADDLDYFTMPTDLARVWERPGVRATFDWAQRRVQVEKTDR